MRIGKYIGQLAGDSIVYGISGAATALVSLFLIPVLTRVFTPGEYGIVALINVLLGFLGMFVVLGLDNSSARWFYDTHDTKDRRSTISSWFWCQLAASLIAAAALLVSAPRVSLLLCGTNEHSLVVRLAALTIPFQTVAKVLGNWFRYQRRPWAAVTFTIADMLSRVGLILLFVLVWHYGLGGLFAARLISAFVVAAVAVVLLRNWISTAAFSSRRLKSMLRYGLPLVPAAVGLWAMMWADRFILKTFRTTDEVGLYAVAAQIAAGAALVVAAFQQAWGPFAYSILHERESNRVYARVFDLYSFLGCALCTAIALFAPLLVRLLSTEPFYPAASCVAFLAFACLLNGLRSIAALGCSIAKNSKPVAASIGIGAVANVGLNFLLVPEFGREGAAVATVAAFGCSVIYLFAASQKEYRIPYRWHTGLACFLFAWAVIGIDWWLVPGGSVSAFVIRVAMLLLFIPLGVFLGLIRWRDLEQLIRRPGAEPELDSKRSGDLDMPPRDSEYPPRLDDAELPSP